MWNSGKADPFSEKWLDIKIVSYAFRLKIKKVEGTWAVYVSQVLSNNVSSLNNLSFQMYC